MNNQGFFIQNDSRTLDQQNEWYYNPTTHKLQIYSTSQPINVKVSSVDKLVYSIYKNYYCSHFESSLQFVANFF